MKLIVNPHKIEIKKELVNEREIDITKCEFEFADEITAEYVKEAYFTFKGVSYKQLIINNECDIPNEVLAEKGQVEIGVVAYLVESEEEIKRYNPSPAYFNTLVGSLKDNVENTEPITPTDKEQIEQAIANLEVDKQDKLIAGDNITIEDNVISAVDTIYDDTEVKSDIEDLETNKADRTEIPDVSNFVTKSVDDLINYYLKSETYTKAEVNNLIGSIEQLHFEIVEQLPSTGSSNIIYLVPRSESEESNVYDEYIYTNNDWEKIGSTDIDLSGYVTTSDLNTALSNYTTTANLTTLLAGKQDTIDSSHKLSSDLVDDTNNTNKFVTASEKTTWNNKIGQTEYLKTIAKKESTGSVVKISDGFDDLPVIDLTVGIEPKQAGSGTPSPTNVRALSGWESVKVKRLGKNLLDLTNRVQNTTYLIQTSNVPFDKKYIYTWFASTGYNIPKNNFSYTLENNKLILTVTNVSSADNAYGVGFNVEIKPNTTYTISCLDTDAKIRPTFYDKNGKYISYTTDKTFTTPENAKYIILCCYFSISSSQIGTDITKVFDEIQLEAGSEATDYEPYNVSGYQEITIDLGRTVYGGTLDVTTGELIVEYNMVDMGNLTWVKDGTNHRFYTNTLTTLIKDQSTTWSDDLVCSMYKSIKTSGGTDDLCVSIYDDNTYRRIYAKDTTQDETTATDFKTYVTGQTIVYPIATPQTYQLTPVQINTLLGNNTVYADCGDSDLKYYADITEVLDELDNKIDDVQVNGTSIVSNGVANIPMGTTQSLGVVKAKSDAGTTINQSGELIVNPASDQQIKEGTGNRRPITPDKENASVFYGLAKASGDTTQASSTNPVGTYTDTAKQKIREMLGAESNEWEKLVDKTLQVDSTTALAYTDYAYEGKFKKIMIQIRGTVDTNNANISFYRSTNSSAYQVFGNVARNSDTLYEFIMEGSPYLQSTAIRDSSVELKVYNVASNTWTMLYQGRAPMATKMDEVTDLKITSNGNFLTGTRVVVWGLR